MDNQNIGELKQNLNSLKAHRHDFIKDETYEVCKICGKKRLFLEEVAEGLQRGLREDGKTYSVRENRMAYFMPDIWEKMYNALGSKKAKLTALMLLQTGARINEARNIRKIDIDFQRNTIRLVVTKTKAKKGERKGKPRTIPINSDFIKQLNKQMKEEPDEKFVGLLSTCAFNIALKKALQEIGVKDYYMYSAHNIRKTHGNWLKILGNLGMIKCDAMEICLRLGHDYNTFLKDYGSSGVMDTKDVITAKKLLGDLYAKTNL